MHQEIEDILRGLVPSKWSKEEIEEVFKIIYPHTIYNKQSIKGLCNLIKLKANLLRHPDPEDNLPNMWVSTFLFTSFKKLPLFINHKNDFVKLIVQYRLGKGK